ncbi:hypothetical protein BM734_18040 [Bacillus velezensis]|nr:hypothetical protein AFK74_18130 [Bacillus amyloliquefaciens]MBG9698703.1 hypothetical protein [Bacillus amyloliquefaciens]OOI00820.1 hypothetical protein BM734_18040 [Bacillus velezensis]
MEIAKEIQDKINQLFLEATDIIKMLKDWFIAFSYFWGRDVERLTIDTATQGTNTTKKPAYSISWRFTVYKR